MRPQPCRNPLRPHRTPPLDSPWPAAVGILAGSASALLLVSLAYASEVREAHIWIVALLPLAGLAVGVLYKYLGASVEAGNNLILDEIHAEVHRPDAVIPFRMTPLILLGTFVTHLFGGSAGREGTAIQTGASLADQLCRPFHPLIGTGRRQRRIVLMMGVSRRIRLRLRHPARRNRLRPRSPRPRRAHLRGHRALPPRRLPRRPRYPRLAHPPHPLTPWTPSPKSLSSASPPLPRRHRLRSHGHGLRKAHPRHQTPRHPQHRLGTAAAIYRRNAGRRGRLHPRHRTHPPIPRTGRSRDRRRLPPAIAGYDFAAKTLFTAVTLGTGFKGGEVTPLFYIGATMGNALAHVVPLPATLLAGMGFVAVFAGAANTPIASTLMAVELFGAEAGAYCGIACVLSYLFSGHSGIYTSQRVGRPKHTP